MASASCTAGSGDHGALQEEEPFGSHRAGGGPPTVGDLLQVGVLPVVDDLARVGATPRVEEPGEAMLGWAG